jgi:hypothetical protein
MAPTGTNTTQSKTTTQSPAESTGFATYARQTAERSVDVPVGAALTVADRVNEIIDPFTTRETATRELRSIRTRVERELNRLERRGGSARRKARTRARQTRNRVERVVNQRRRRVETTVRQNRRKAEHGLKRAQTVVQERVSTLV